MFWRRRQTIFLYSVIEMTFAPEILILSYGSKEIPLRNVPEPWNKRIMRADQYSLQDVLTSDIRAILIPMHVDQRFLASRAALLEQFVLSGGRMVVNGHVLYPFVPELGLFKPLFRYRVDDLYIDSHAPHPVWDGVDIPALTFRKGVAGFYGRGYHTPPPQGTFINTIGPKKYPVDCVYSHGAGEILVHSGNDLWSFVSEDGSPRLALQLLNWVCR